MINIPAQFASLKYIGPIKWADIFGKWREYEAGQESWKRHWEERGFASWDEWRVAYAAPLSPDKLDWQLYEVGEPLKDFPNIYGVPTRSWVDKAYGGKTTKLLKDLLSHPIITDNRKIDEIKKNFPKETMLTGLVYKNGIVLIEGMHRACAIAGWDPKIPFTGKVTLALAAWDKQDIPVIGGNYKK